MDKLFPAMIANKIQEAGCHASVAENVYHALCELPDNDCIILWLRLQGRSYGDIGETMEMNKGRVWKIIHGSIRKSVYSIIEHSTAIPATAMLS